MAPQSTATSVIGQTSATSLYSGTYVNTAGLQPTAASAVTQGSTASQVTAASIANGSSTTSASANTTQKAHSSKSTSSGLSGGAVAGVAIAALLVGALIASAIFIVLQKKRHKNRRSHGNITTGGASRTKQEDKSARSAVEAVPSMDSFDMDRLLPQPFDDAKIKNDVKTLFTQIDGHVENFYTDGNINSNVRVSADASESDLLFSTRTRFFAIKRLICLAMIEAIDPNCSTEMSLLPTGFGTLARQLKDFDLDDQTNALSWSRVRVSMVYLLKNDLGSTERRRVDHAISEIIQRVNAQIQPFELAGTQNNRTTDLDAICRSSAALGKVLLSQPASWKFEWLAGPNSAATSRPQLVYFPSLVRLTDNKAKKLRTPHVAIQARATSL